MLTGATLVLAAGIVVAVMVMPRPDRGDSHEAPAAERLLPESAARAGAVVVAEPVADLGHIPLNVPVEHVFHLVNVGAEPVQLGNAVAAVLDGC